MSPPGRPKGEYRRAKHEGAPISPPGRRRSPSPWRVGTLLAAAVVLVGCAAGSGRPTPTPLEPLANTTAARLQWSGQVGTVSFPVQVDTAGQTFYVAGGDGTVTALALEDGRERWRTQVDDRLSAGVGSDGRYTAVVTRGGELVVLEAGAVRWRQRLPAPVATPPFVAGERVFVQSLDRAAHAFDAATGARLWSLPRGGDALTLSQAGVSAAVGNTLLLGQSGRLLGLDPLTGRIVWSVVLSNPRGTNELERVVDLVGRVGRVGDTVCLRAYQSAIGCVNARRGALEWVRPSNGAVGVDADETFVYSVEASSRVVAHRRGGGEEAWSTDRFLFRGLGTPLVIGNTLVVGDAQGFVHLLDAREGTPTGRFATDGSAVVGTPARIGNTAVFATARGGVYAYRIE